MHFLRPPSSHNLKINFNYKEISGTKNRGKSTFLSNCNLNLFLRNWCKGGKKHAFFTSNTLTFCPKNVISRYSPKFHVISFTAFQNVNKIYMKLFSENLAKIWEPMLTQKVGANHRYSQIFTNIHSYTQPLDFLTKLVIGL